MSKSKEPIKSKFLNILSRLYYKIASKPSIENKKMTSSDDLDINSKYTIDNLSSQEKMLNSINRINDFVIKIDKLQSEETIMNKINTINKLAIEIENLQLQEKITNKINIINNFVTEIDNLRLQEKITNKTDQLSNIEIENGEVSLQEKIIDIISKLDAFIMAHPNINHIPLSIISRYIIHQQFINDLPKIEKETEDVYGSVFSLKQMCPKMESVYLHYYLEILNGKKEIRKKFFLKAAYEVWDADRGCPHCTSQYIIFR